MVRWGTPEPQGVKLLATLKDINGKTVSKENVIITVVDEMRTLLKGCHTLYEKKTEEQVAVSAAISSVIPVIFLIKVLIYRSRKGV